MKKLTVFWIVIFLGIVVNACGKGATAKNSSFTVVNNSPEISGNGIYYLKENYNATHISYQ